jgi:(2Fe-2S) ferredoxin
MKTTKVQQSTYQIEGEFLGFIPKPGGELKYIQVQVAERIIPIKLAKELRETLARKLVEGDRLSIFLEQTSYGQGRKLKLKTDKVLILGSQDQLPVPLPSSTPSFSQQKQKEKVLLCRKSSCSKQGGQELYSVLQATLKQLGLQDRVSIELTGCQKQCKKAPSIILMPGKVKYSKVNPHKLASLLKAHYLSNSPQLV